jgi:hypothetical protein
LTTITRRNLKGKTISSLKLQTRGLRVYYVANKKGTKLTPCNGGNFKAKGVHTERAMINSWTGNNPWQRGITKGEAPIQPKNSI